jgi:hypothetical protein
MSKNRTLLLVVALACASAGCYNRTESGDEAVYSFQPWVPVAVGVGGVGLAAIGVVWARRGDRLRGIVVTAGALLLLSILVPATILDRVIVGPDRLYWDTGMWVSPNRHEVRWSEVARASVEVEMRQTRHGPEKSYFLVFELKSGQRDRMPISDLMKEAFPEVMDQLKQHDIPLSIPPDADVE